MNGWFGNRLLDGLPASSVAAISPYLRRAYLHRGQQLSFPGSPLRHFLFPIDALLWDWAPSPDGPGTVSLFESGCRGAAGGSAWFMPPAPGYITALLPGVAWLLSEEASKATQGDAAFYALTNRWLYDRFNVAAHRLVCAAEHNLDRRLARALMWIIDETGRPEIALTHREIATMTAIRRPSVSLTLAEFQKRGIVRLQHGLVQVADGQGLGRQCCSCYARIRSAVESQPYWPLDHGQDASVDGQISISRTSHPGDWESAKTIASATLDGALS